LNPELLTLQQRLKHSFANPRLLERAVTHRSFTSDHNARYLRAICRVCEPTW